MDGILRTLICGGQVSLVTINATELVNRAIEIHKTSPEASKILGGLLVCGAYFSCGLKEKTGSVSITVKAKDGDGAVSVSADAAMHVRGYADGACTQTLAGGTLTVVREDGFSQPFVGTCEIASDDISDILETYFGQSEQIPTAVAISVNINENGRCDFAGGVVMQLLPNAEQAQIDVAGDLFYVFKSKLEVTNFANSNEDFSAQGILNLFKPANLGEVNASVPAYICNCSEHKIRGVLSAVGREELLEICKERGEVRVHCHYCNKDYIYDAELIEEIFG
ncbi:MAG: Hsp33 family molecular chaperone HslO [Clostridia bacterium]|nr:Hsp33 family molecular chaperone HslO [Clostridia bacterium]